MSNQASKVIGKESIDEIRKIDDAVANILSKLDVAAASSAVATNTATAIIADSHSDSNNNKNSNNLNQDNFTEVYRKLLFTLTYNSEFVMQMGIHSFHINPQEIDQIIYASKNYPVNMLKI